MKKFTRRISIYSTNVDIVVYHENEEILDEVENLLKGYNMKLSMFEKDAWIYKLNKFKSFDFDSEIFELIKLGKFHSFDSNFNIALAPVIKLWNIGENSRLPNEVSLKEALAKSSPRNIKLDEEKFRVELLQGAQLDLGAIAKGFIADKIKEFLKTRKVKSAMINLGGNVLTFGLNYNSLDLNWRIGLQHPDKERGNHLAIFAINDLSMVTSGIYERNFELEGETYHHIFDRFTGYPKKSKMKSITVIAKSSVLCDIWTSKLFGMDIEDTINLVNENIDLEAIVIDLENKMHFSEGIKKYLLWKEEQ